MSKTIAQRYEEGQTLQKAVNNTHKAYEMYVRRIKKRIEEMLLEPYSYFMTFTIKDEYINLTKDKIIRKIKEALGSASNWLFNEDYGSTNGRLHFHAFASYELQLDYNTIPQIYKYGSIDIIQVKNKNETAIRKYIMKTTNHAIKSSAGKIYRSRRLKNGK